MGRRACLLWQVSVFFLQLGCRAQSPCECHGVPQAAAIWADLRASIAQGPESNETRVPLRCGLWANSVGRILVQSENPEWVQNCPAGAAAEAATCAIEAQWRHPSVELALPFVDQALSTVASLGPLCFDESSWGRGLGFSTKGLLEIHGLVLHAVTRALPSGYAVPPEREGRWSTMGMGGPECPAQDDAAAEAKLTEPVLVYCLVPLVWPAQKPFMEAIQRTWGPDCDETRFFVSLDEDAHVASDFGSEVINLRAIYPMVPPDRDIFHRAISSTEVAHIASNTITKLLHMLRWASEHGSLHLRGASRWFCRIERDTYFIPENFRFLVAKAGLNASELHYLGTRQFIDAPRFGLVFNDGGPGVCLSEAALTKLRDVIARAPLLPLGSPPPSFESCVFAAGHREDLMLGACLRQAGVFASAATTDSRGREWFSIRPLQGIDKHRPAGVIESDVGGSMAPAWNFWAGRAHIYLPCLRSNDFWVVDTPCSFNSFKNVSMFDQAHALLALPLAQRRQQLGGYPASRSGLTRGRLTGVIG